MSQPSKEVPPAEQRGFGHSRRRIVVEGGLLVGGVLALLALFLWFASHFVEFAANWLPPDVDVALGMSAWEQMAPAEQRCANPEALSYVESLSRPLLDQIDSPYEFRFAVVDDPDVNAFALPGGFVTVNSGLLEKAESGEEVMAVLAHELAHVTERHGTKRVARQVGTLVLVSLLLGGTDFESLAVIAANLAGTAYDRDQEAEADQIGQELLKGAGVSPEAMATFFERIRNEGAQVPTLLSTHPDPGDRAESARAAALGFTPSRSLKSPEGIVCE